MSAWPPWADRASSTAAEVKQAAQGHAHRARYRGGLLFGDFSLGQTRESHRRPDVTRTTYSVPRITLCLLLPTSRLLCEQMCCEFGVATLAGKVGAGSSSRRLTGGEVCRTCKSRIHRPGKPGRWCLSLVRPRESHQREGRPGIARYARTLCCLLGLGGCGTRTIRPRAATCSNSPRRHPRGQSSCSARYRGPKYVKRKAAQAARTRAF